MRRVLLAVLTVLVAAAPAAAQQRQLRLRQVVDGIAVSWRRGDAGAVIRHAARAGVSLEMRGGPMGPLSPRQAAAVLRRVFDDMETLSVRTAEVEVTGGQPARAYAEIAWIVRMRGSTVAEPTRVFVGLVEENGDWRVTQIRLMR